MTKPLRDMTVKELRQLARDMGLSTVTKLDRKVELVRALEKVQVGKTVVYLVKQGSLTLEVYRTEESATRYAEYLNELFKRGTRATVSAVILKD